MYRVLFVLIEGWHPLSRNFAIVVKFADMSQLLLACTWLSCTGVQRLMNKHSACSTCPNEKAVGRSILLASKNVRIGGNTMFSNFF